jgi:cellulose biosynthesis protein BcsQ
MRIAFLNQKGGVGKSTTCIAFGSVLKLAGHKVAFEDCDPQGSVSFWAREVGDIPLLEEQPDAEIVLCDTPGRVDLGRAGEESLISKIIRDADRLVIVTEGSLFSIHATTPMARLVHANKRDQARVFLLLNKVRPGRKANSVHERNIAYRLGLPLLHDAIPLAAGFEHIQTEGIYALKPCHLEIVLRLALEIIR